MVGKRVRFDNETWAAIAAATSESGRSFQDIADGAFSDFLKKHKQPVELKDALNTTAASFAGSTTP